MIDPHEPNLWLWTYCPGCGERLEADEPGLLDDVVAEHLCADRAALEAEEVDELDQVSGLVASLAIVVVVAALAVLELAWLGWWVH